MSIIQYTLTLLEPVLVTAPGGDPNTDESQDYIPGSAIRGALAGMHKKKASNDFASLFLDGRTRFLNAYPAHEGQRLLPTPQHWITEKDAEPAAGGQMLHDLTQGDPDFLPKPIGKPFMSVQGNEVLAKRPSYDIAVHNARNREKGRAIPNDVTNRSALFRYHALAKGQTFIGKIITQNKTDADTLRNLLTGTILLGGSSTAGYGLTEITRAEITADDELEMSVSSDIVANSTFLVYLTSDAIVRHPESGQPGSYLCESLQASLPNHTFTIHKVWGRSGWVGGFNRYWGLPLPQSYALLKGSIWQLQTAQPITAADIRKIELAGIGERRAEGFGSLVINPNWPNNLHMVEIPPKPQLLHAQTAFSELSTQSRELLTQMNQRIAQQELDKLLATAVTTLNKNGLRRLSNSQLARLRLTIRQEMNKPDEQFKRFRQYLRGTSERKSADDQFRKSRLGNRNFRDWLTKLAQQPDSVWREINLSSPWQEVEGKWQRPLLGADPFQLTPEIAHQYTIRLIDAVCEQAAQARRER